MSLCSACKRRRRHGARVPGVLCASLDEECPVCWSVWRSLRSSPSVKARDEEHEGFVSNLTVPSDKVGGNAFALHLRIEGEEVERVGVRVERTTRKRFLEQVKRVPLDEDMASEMTFRTVRNWLARCSAGHSCSGDTLAAVIPTRLVDLHGRESKMWSIVETNGDAEKYNKYVALSHRWSSDTPQLRQENWHLFKEGQPDDVLPRDYQDILSLCRRLEARYVWIDSLCIFQDSAEDFQREAATMMDVYMNAFFTETAVSNAPINRRGWVLQERLLSPRILYLGNDQVYWECHELMTSEAAPNGMPRGVECRSREPIAKSQDNSRWQHLVREYTQNELTFEADRLVAFTGIAKLVAQRTQDAYMAGMFKRRLLFDLLWAPATALPPMFMDKFDRERLRCSTKRTPGDGVPSWSWAASSGPVDWLRPGYWGRWSERELYEFSLPMVKRLAWFEGSNFMAGGYDEDFGKSEGASLDMMGLLIPARFDDTKMQTGLVICQPGLHYRDMPGSEGVVFRPASCTIMGATVDFRFSRRYDASLPCYMMPLLDINRAPKEGFKDEHVEGLVVQEVKGWYVRIGSFDAGCYDYNVGLYTRALNALLEGGGEGIEWSAFEKRLRAYVIERKRALWDGRDHADATVKARWGVIRLV
ncbi:hypothetical protein ACJZ2D_000824 [Fusarium nematophilum]